MPNEPEDGFIIRDRRRVLLDEPDEEDQEVPPAHPVSPAVPIIPVTPGAPPMPFAPGPSAPAPNAPFAGTSFFGAPAPEPEPEPQPMMGMSGMGGENPNEVPDVYSVLIVFLNEMFSQAILRLGLAPNPRTGKLERDMDQARVAIDTLTYLAQQIAPILPPDDALPLRARINDLQRQYMMQAQQRGGVG